MPIDIRTMLVATDFSDVSAPATAIMSWAAAKQVQLIVMGTHGRHGVTRFLIGSVAGRVLRVAPCAVLVVPATLRPADSSPAAAT